MGKQLKFPEKTVEKILTGKDTGYGTPLELFAELQDEFGKFDLDAAAAPDNALCDAFYTKEMDGLKQPWARRTFCNPPFSPAGEVTKWIRKAIKERERGNLTVMVLNSDTGTNYWHEEAIPHAEVRLYKGRFKYRFALGGAKKPGQVLIFFPKRERKFQFIAIGNVGGYQ